MYCCYEGLIFISIYDVVMNERLGVWIQIVNYNSKQYLNSCLDSLLNNLKNSSISFHVFVLDNASGDDLSDLEQKYSQIRFLSIVQILMEGLVMGITCFPKNIQLLQYCFWILMLH